MRLTSLKILRQLAVPNEEVFYLQDDSAGKKKKKVVTICFSFNDDKEKGEADPQA